MFNLDFFVDEYTFGMSQAIQKSSTPTLGKNLGSLVWLLNKNNNFLSEHAWVIHEFLIRVRFNP